VKKHYWESWNLSPKSL